MVWHPIGATWRAAPTAVASCPGIGLAVGWRVSMLSNGIPRPQGRDDRLFGSVTAITISELLNEKGFQIDRKAVHLDEPIKSLGLHNVAIKLHPEVEVQLKIYVIKE